MQRTPGLIAAFAALLAFAPIAGSARAAGLCGAAQTTYFSCPTARHRAIALCGAVPTALQYRYGTPSRIELAFPANAADGASQLGYAHYARYQAERTEVTFSRVGVDYAVFDYTEQGRRRAGVQVTTADGEVHEVACAGAIEGRLDTLGTNLRCDPDNALNGGRCP